MCSSLCFHSLHICRKADKHKRGASELFAVVTQTLLLEDAAQRAMLVKEEARCRHLTSRYAADSTKPRQIFFWGLVKALYPVGDMGTMTQKVAQAQFEIFARKADDIIKAGSITKAGSVSDSEAGGVSKAGGISKAGGVSKAQGTCDSSQGSGNLQRILRADNTVWLPAVARLKTRELEDRQEFEGTIVVLQSVAQCICLWMCSPKCGYPCLCLYACACMCIGCFLSLCSLQRMQVCMVSHSQVEDPKAPRGVSTSPRAGWCARAA